MKNLLTLIVCLVLFTFVSMAGAYDLTDPRIRSTCVQNSIRYCVAWENAGDTVSVVAGMVDGGFYHASPQYLDDNGKWQYMDSQDKLNVIYYRITWEEADQKWGY